MSALGINNSGEMTMPYGKEDIDYRADGDPSSGYIFNAADSVLFRRVRELFKSELSALFLRLESKNCWSSNSLINQFDTSQNEFCEELWRLDYERKYERTYRDGNTRFLETMMNGRKKYHRRQFERDQEKYMATKYFGTTATSDQIMFRCNTPVDAIVTPDYTLHLTPYSDMYLSVMFGATYRTQIRAKAGQQYDIPCPFETMDDTAVLIYCASRMQSIGDVSACYIHDNDFSKGEKLQELIIGNDTEGYSNIFLTNLVIGNNRLLKKLDIQNTPNLVTSLNLSGCPNLEELYAEGSGIAGVVFANGGKIRTAHLPGTLTSVNMKNLMYLTDLTFAGYDQMTNIVFENSNVVDCVDILEKASNIGRARIIGIDWNLEDDSLLDRIYNMTGIDQNGYNTDQSVLAGSVFVPVMREQKLADYRAAWQDLEITYNTIITQFTITFANADGTVLDVQYVDKGSMPVDPVTRPDNPIQIPTLAPTVSTEFAYKGWDIPFVPAFQNMTYTATYSETVRNYRVRYLSKGNVLYEVTAPYGTTVFYTGDLPTYTAEESGFNFYLFTGWDKSGYVNGDKDINAVFDSFNYSAGCFDGKELSDLRPVELYGMIADNVKVEADHIGIQDELTLQLGHDYSYDDIEEHVVIDTPVIFDGTTHVDTGVKLFDVDRSFVLAIDYQFDKNSAANSVLAQCFQTDGVSGIKLWNNSGARLSWSTSSTIASEIGKRDMLVIRHVKGETGVYVYCSSLSKDAPTYTELTRTRSTITEATLVFGAAKADDGAFENHAVGQIFWSKVWFADLGDTACKDLAAWTHESMTFQMCGFKRYYLSANSAKRSSMTFLAKNLLSVKRKLTNNTTNAGGYAACQLPDYLNKRLFKALPLQWQQLIKQVKVNSSVGNQSMEISSSDAYIHIPCAYELDASMTQEPYCYEGTPITFFSTNQSRVCTYEDGTAGAYWVRTPNQTYSSYYYRVETTGELSGYYYGYNEEGLRIMFSI